MGFGALSLSRCRRRGGDADGFAAGGDGDVAAAGFFGALVIVLPTDFLDVLLARERELKPGAVVGDEAVAAYVVDGWPSCPAGGKPPSLCSLENRINTVTRG